jgi:hypothetical protein
MSKFVGAPMPCHPRIARITAAYVRTYSDTGQTVGYVEWRDSAGCEGRTEGNPTGPHMRALFDRARREGCSVRTETW